MRKLSLFYGCILLLVGLGGCKPAPQLDESPWGVAYGFRNDTSVHVMKYLSYTFAWDYGEQNFVRDSNYERISKKYQADPIVFASLILDRTPAELYIFNSDKCLKISTLAVLWIIDYEGWSYEDVYEYLLPDFVYEGEKYPTGLMDSMYSDRHLIYRNVCNKIKEKYQL